MKILTKALSILFIFFFCTTGIVAASSNENVSMSTLNNSTVESSTPELIVDNHYIDDSQAEEENISRDNSTNSTNSTSEYMQPAAIVNNNSNDSIQADIDPALLTDLNNSNASVPTSLPVKTTPEGDNIINVQIIMNNVTITGIPPEQAKTAEVKTIPQADLNKSPIDDSAKKTLPTEQEVRATLNTSNAHNYTEIEALIACKHWYADRYYMTFDSVSKPGEEKHTSNMVMDVIYINQPEGKGGYGRIGVYADGKDLYDILPEPFAIGKPVTIQSMTTSSKVVTTPVRTAVIKWKHLKDESVYTVKSEPASKSVQVVVVKDTPTRLDRSVNKTSVNTQPHEATTTPDIKIENSNNVGNSTYRFKIYNMFNNIKIEAQNIYITITGK
jgi:hypothetical protein